MKAYTMKVFTFLELQNLLLDFQRVTQEDDNAYTPLNFLHYINDHKVLDAVEKMVTEMDWDVREKQEFLKHYRSYKKLKEKNAATKKAV